jgi:hypothetical protein
LPLVPIATFLAGSLLTLLLPILLLIALVAWYWWFSARVPDTADGNQSNTAPAPADPGHPSIPETLPPEPGAK